MTTAGRFAGPGSTAQTLPERVAPLRPVKRTGSTIAPGTVASQS